MARIAIFGASGLIGSEIAEQLAADGFDILAVARRFADDDSGSRCTRREIPFVASGWTSRRLRKCWLTRTWTSS